MRKLASILLWSAISAAFIGPGTVTTAGTAGARFGLDLLWVLALSTIVCLVLQEASARLAVASGLGLAGAIRERFGRLPAILVVASVVFGCAAFEAGNILGAAAGASLLIPVSARWIAGGCGVLAGAVLLSRSPHRVARLMGVLVAVMGAAFLAAAAGSRPAAAELVRALVPAVPDGSATLVLALFGTTVVPYNLFLGARLARGQSLDEVRFGLAIAIPLGGLISMAVLVVGTAVDGRFDYLGLADTLALRLGPWAAAVFAIGLAVAGLSSAVTAPLAAAITLADLAQRDAAAKPWRHHATWSGVLAVGLGFGIAGIPPIPAIILAQAVNGALLPLVAVFLLLALNDRRLMSPRHLAGPRSNLSLALAVLAAVTLGVTTLLRAAERTLGLAPFGETTIFAVALATAVVLAIPVVRTLLRLRTDR